MSEYLYGRCPTQLEGVTRHSRPFYFRARHGRWDLRVGPENAAPQYLDWAENEELIGDGEDPTIGEMLPADVDALITEYVGAGWVRSWEWVLAQSQGGQLR